MSVVAKWLDRIKMSLGTEVGLGPGNIVLDADPAPPLQRAQPHPQFLAHVCCGQTAEWTKMPLGTKVGLGPGHIVLHLNPGPRGKGGHPNFQPMSIVASRSSISATVEHLLCAALCSYVMLFYFKMSRHACGC